MRIRFTATAQVVAYLSSDRIECLECGKRFAFLANHIRRVHGIDSDEYRELWGLPTMTPLAGQSYRTAHREKMQRMQTDGSLTYDHLTAASQKAVGAPRGKSGVAKIEHAAIIAKLRPSDAHRLPPGAKRADGRDADTARTSQQRRREQAKLKQENITMYRVYLLTFDQQVTEKTNTPNQQTALDAFAELVSRNELDGRELAAVLTYQKRQLAFHRFDRNPGDSDYWRDKLDQIEWPEVGRPAKLAGGKRVNVYLDASSLTRAAELGSGNVSEGIRIALAALPGQ